MAAHETLLSEIQRPADTDAGEEPDEDLQADNVTLGQKKMIQADSEPDWNITPDDFADEDLASLIHGDGKTKVELLAAMHMLKLQRLTSKLGKTVRNEVSSMRVKDDAAFDVLHSQIMAKELWFLNRKIVPTLRNNLL